MTENPKFQVGDYVVTPGSNVGIVSYVINNTDKRAEYVVFHSGYSFLFNESDLTLHEGFKFAIGDTVYLSSGDPAVIVHRLLCPGRTHEYIVETDSGKLYCHESALTAHPKKFWVIVRTNSNLESAADISWYPIIYYSLADAQKDLDGLNWRNQENKYSIMELLE